MQNFDPIKRICAGLPAYHEMAVRRALAQLVTSAEKIPPSAYLEAALTSYSLDASAGAEVSVEISPDAPFIVCAWSPKLYLAEPASDDASMFTLKIEGNSWRPVGDSRGGVKLSCLVDLDQWSNLPLPWIFKRNNSTFLRFSSDAGISGAAELSVGLSGFYILGL